DDLKDAADGVAGAKDFVYLSLHALLRFRVFAVEQNFVTLGKLDQFVPFAFAAAVGAADLNYVAQHADPELPQKQFGNRTDGYACGGLARRSPFQNVASLREVVLERAGQIGMSGT